MRKLTPLLALLFIGLIAFHRPPKEHFGTTPYIQYSTAGSGTVVIDDVKSDVVLIHESAALVLNMSVTFPETPQDGQRVTVLSVNGITALLVNTPVGSLATLLTTLASGNAGTWVYSAARNKWYKLR